MLLAILQKSRHAIHVLFHDVPVAETYKLFIFLFNAAAETL